MGWNPETRMWEKTDHRQYQGLNDLYNDIVQDQPGATHVGGETVYNAPDNPLFWKPDYQDQVIEHVNKDIGPFFADYKQYYYVDLPWPLSLIMGRLRFNTQEEAQAFVDNFIRSVETVQKEAFPISLGVLFAGLGYQTTKHPAEMAGVIAALGNAFTGTIKGIGEVIPG